MKYLLLVMFLLNGLMYGQKYGDLGKIVSKEELTFKGKGYGVVIKDFDRMIEGVFGYKTAFLYDPEITDARTKFFKADSAKYILLEVYTIGFTTCSIDFVLAEKDKILEGKSINAYVLSLYDLGIEIDRSIPYLLNSDTFATYETNRKIEHFGRNYCRGWEVIGVDDTIKIDDLCIGYKPATSPPNENTKWIPLEYSKDCRTFQKEK